MLNELALKKRRDDLVWSVLFQMPQQDAEDAVVLVPWRASLDEPQRIPLDHQIAQFVPPLETRHFVKCISAVPSWPLIESRRAPPGRDQEYECVNLPRSGALSVGQTPRGRGSPRIG